MKRGNYAIFSVVSGIGLFFLLTLQIGTVLATHAYTGIRWPTTTAGPLCIDNSMGYLNIGLSRSNDALYTAYASINNLDSRYTIRQIANTGDCHSRVYGASLSISTTGRTDGYGTSSRVSYENMVMNRNIQWTSTGCVDGHYPLRLSYAMRHEFAHWVILKHTPDETSITYPNYYCRAWDATINSHDAGTIRAIYG